MRYIAELLSDEIFLTQKIKMQIISQRKFPDLQYLQKKKSNLT